jgi:polysaccharide export outer membrane protein
VTISIYLRVARDLNMRALARSAVVFAAAALVAGSPAGAQSVASGSSSAVAAPSPASSAPLPVAVPADYVIGPEDQLSIVFWRDKDLSSEVVVRPDGKISLPLLNDVQAGGLTPEQLRQVVTEQAKRYVEDPTASVVVRQINSRRVFVTGEVAKPGSYALVGPTTVLQLLATAGGLNEYAGRDKIVILRREDGREVAYRFNYKQVTQQKNPKQNIELKPGDTVVVP